MTMSNNLRKQRDLLSYLTLGQGAIVPEIAIFRGARLYPMP